jgi:hypothetical protein
VTPPWKPCRDAINTTCSGFHGFSDSANAELFQHLEFHLYVFLGASTFIQIFLSSKMYKLLAYVWYCFFKTFTFNLHVVHSYHPYGVCSISLRSEPTSQDAKPRVKPGVQPPFYITNVGGELRVKPGVWRPEMWALQIPFITLSMKLIIENHSKLYRVRVNQMLPP